MARGDTSHLLLAVSTAQRTGLLRCPPGSGQQVETRAHPYFRFQPDSCRQAANSVHFNRQAPPLSWRPGQFYAWLMQNPAAGSGRILRTITLRRQPLRNAPELEAGEPFRLRIMAVDPQTGGPGEDLLTENVVVSFPPLGRAFTFVL